MNKPGSYQGIEAFNQPHNEEQPIIDAIETQYDSVYFEKWYDPDDYLPDPSEDYDSELLEDEI